jgi:hypothetical protein
LGQTQQWRIETGQAAHTVQILELLDQRGIRPEEVWIGAVQTRMRNQHRAFHRSYSETILEQTGDQIGLTATDLGGTRGQAFRDKARAGNGEGEQQRPSDEDGVLRDEFGRRENTGSWYSRGRKQNLWVLL